MGRAGQGLSERVGCISPDDVDGRVANQRKRERDRSNVTKQFSSRHRTLAVGVALQHARQVPGLRWQLRPTYFFVPIGRVCLRTCYPQDYKTMLCPVHVSLLLVPFLLCDL